MGDEGDSGESITESTKASLSIPQPSPTRPPSTRSPVQETPNPSTVSPEAPSAGERVPISGSSTPPTLGNFVPRESSFGDVSSAAKTKEPDLVVTGEAGLFCDANFDFKQEIWSGSVEKLEDMITRESGNNQSEELARNAVIASAVFGTIITFIVILECFLGWRVCLERCIIGLIAMCATISQGVTLLFFNSQQYC